MVGKFLLALVLVCLWESPASAQTQPAASTPTGSEIVTCLQGGSPRGCTTSQIASVITRQPNVWTYPQTWSALSLSSPTTALLNITGTSQAVYNNLPALGWELAQGTAVSPLTSMGSSLKVSRTENYASTAACNSTYNDNGCNAAILGVSVGLAGDQMQTAGVVGMALGYQTSVVSGESLDNVGVTGQGRTVGSGIGVGTGAFFQGIADCGAATSPTCRAIGIESNIKNLTGTDAVSDIVDGGGFPNVLVSCGAGTYPNQWKCGSGVQITNSGRNYLYGVVVTAAADIASFVDNSSATSGLWLNGSHTNLIKSSGFNVNGSGNLWIGSGYNSATTEHLTILSNDSNQGYIGSTGAQNVILTLDNQAGGNQDQFSFKDAGVLEWQLGKDASNNFYLFDQTGGANVLHAFQGGALVIGETKGVTFNPTTFAALPTCSGAAGTVAYITDASAAITTWHQQVTAGGGSNKAYIACNGTGWFAFDY